MISPEATALNASFRIDLKGSGAFTIPFAEQRTNWDEFGKSIPEYSRDVSIEAVDCDGTPCEWVVAPGASENKVLLHFHGGGYVIGHPDGYRNFNSRISEAVGARVLAVDYRLAPEHPFPAALEDTLRAYKWLLAQGHQPAQIGFIGESAGGGLVCATLLAARGEGVPLPAAAVAVSPWVDLTNKGDSHTFNADADPMLEPTVLDPYTAAYLNGADSKDPLASPVCADLSGLPPIYILVGSTEILLDDARALFMNASRAGVNTTIEVAPEMPHIWPIFAYQLPEGRGAIKRIAAFFGSHFGA
jgi:monoterpene epsilon-lactone hydrolase